MSDLVGNPEDQFSHNEAYFVTGQYTERLFLYKVICLQKLNGGVVMVNFYDLYINCYPINQTVANLSQVAGTNFKLQLNLFKQSSI